MGAVVVVAIILMTIFTDSTNSLPQSGAKPAATRPPDEASKRGTSNRATPGPRLDSPAAFDASEPVEAIARNYRAIYTGERLRLPVDDCFNWIHIDLDVPTVRHGNGSDGDDLQYGSCPGGDAPTLVAEGEKLGVNSKESTADPRRCLDDLEAGLGWETLRNPRQGDRFCVITNRDRVVFIIVDDVDATGALTVNASAWEAMR
ncbi:hypothetical protein Prum_070260 [Phytohabitans rumicis]|uniref:Uncharacterized protein n=2 Tax=Phytohabitans rumicis TaxID=1076125 RepID=A0A6V8LAL1_9ACTN|nr:hypothetical protein Prum_070260 [Phytohabitans rumicis]